MVSRSGSCSAWSNSSSSSRRRSSLAPVRPPPRRTRSSSARSRSRNSARSSAGGAGYDETCTCRARTRLLRFGTPAAAKRSTTFASTPQVIGLTKPSGGGGEYAALIFRICATSVGSSGIQLPMTIRPPGRVTRTISLATSNGFGANIAPKMLTTRSNESSRSRAGRTRRLPGTGSSSSPSAAARRLPASTRLLGDVDAQHVGAEPRRRQRGRAVAAAEVEDLRARW